MSSFQDEEQNVPPLSYRGLVKAKIVDLLSSSDDHYTISLEIWTPINQLLNQLPVSTLADRCSPEDDPMGRLLMGEILSKDPPIATLECALRAFPCSLHENPAAFFIACRDASTEIVSLMMRHVVSGCCCCDGTDGDECPYPWLVSEHITTDAAQAILEACPEGVLKQSPMLSGSCLLDYFLLSPDMVEQRSFDTTLWSKFKLVLLASGYCWEKQQYSPSRDCGSCLSPVHTILSRVFSTPGESVALLQHHGIFFFASISLFTFFARTSNQLQKQRILHFPFPNNVHIPFSTETNNAHFNNQISSPTWSKLNTSFG